MLDAGLFNAILDSISKAMGTDPSEFTNNTMIADLSVDSIIAIEVVATVKAESGLDLPATFIFEYPTIGNLRSAFRTQNLKAYKSKLSSDLSSPKNSIPLSPNSRAASVLELASSLTLSKRDDVTPSKHEAKTKRQEK
jgi:acyl carrier protein